jgi:type IV secretory pathway VirB6-like protein
MGWVRASVSYLETVMVMVTATATAMVMVSS